VSRSAQVALSFFAWWVLVVLPAVLTILGVFGDFSPDTEVGGAVFATWVACYLAQLAWLMVVVPRAVGHTKTWWVFIASLLPWAVDWATPYGLGWGLLWIGVAGALTASMIVLALRMLRLDELGTPVTATVVKVLKNHMNVVINNVYIRRRVLLDIPGPSGSYQGVLHMLCEIGTSPSPGEKIRLRVDPGNPKHFALDPSNFKDDD
jgi:hypothetical protein